MKLEIFKLMKKKFQIFQFIPSQLIIKNQKLAYECEGKWREAKKKIITILLKRLLLNFL